MPLILEEEIDLLEKLGSGQYGEVWKGMRLKELKDQVAVKIFKKICRSETVTNELRIMKELQEVNSQSGNLVNVLETNIVNYNGRNVLCSSILGEKSYSIVLWIKGVTRSKKQRRR